MSNRKRRQQVLEKMLRSKFGMANLAELYRSKVLGAGSTGPLGIAAIQMIPAILDAEFGGARH